MTQRRPYLVTTLITVYTRSEESVQFILKTGQQTGGEQVGELTDLQAVKETAELVDLFLFHMENRKKPMDFYILLI